MMTLEEAGEIILEGRAYEVCIKCDGEGVTKLTKPQAHYGKRHLKSSPTRAAQTKDPTHITCVECRGSGTQLRAEFAEAFAVLNFRDYPRRPPRPGPWGTSQIVGFDEQYQQWVTIDDKDDD